MTSVLNIDNSEESRITLNQYLSKLGLTISNAETADQAIEILTERSIDIVITPLCLHGIGGRGIARWVKANRAGITRVYITTSWKGELELDMLRLDGIEGVLKKPFNFSDIRSAFAGKTS